MSVAFDLMKVPQGGQMGSLKMSIVTRAAELPTYTPSSRTRSATASGGGAGGEPDCQGRTTASITPTRTTATAAATATHSQGLRPARGGAPQRGALPALFQTGAPPHPVGWGTGPPGANGCPVPDGVGQDATGDGGGAGGPGANPAAGRPANAAGGVAIWVRARMSVARSRSGAASAA